MKTFSRSILSFFGFRRAETQEKKVCQEVSFDYSPDGILIVDPETAKFLEFNLAAHENLGYTREEFSRLSIFDVEARESVEETKERIARVIRDGKADFETLQRTKTGESRNVFVTAQYVEFGGKHTYFCTWRDITELKRAQKELAFKTMLLRAQLETIIDGVLVVDDEAHVILCNKHFEELWNVPSEMLEAGKDGYVDDKELLAYVSIQIRDYEQFLKKVNFLYANRNIESKDEI